ncbi:HK97 family phage prohead protease [Rhizobium leguminosarum]|uniref:HK97 family phage prohead protease n=1 Tax=Rhizobium ruizarguesonis TaxID=2081791 RepID=UPI0013BAB213|nr:HK97 family phage prohead protease [Rhizobium ruizarguesonis]NEJ15503.1 HK97 family phage prohead protease [Rhizobium ruizarguesonis]NEK29578.1 HK97 family phage prohead protease [Rhizobium ruizarguesonis]
MKNKHLEFDANFKAVGDEDSGEFEGYGSVFGVIDSYNEVVDKGAFADSLAKNGLPKLLLQHSTWMVGGIYLEAREDERGLYVKGQLNLKVNAAREAYELLKQGALTGLSIGFRTLEEEINRETGITHLKRVRLYEVSIVTFPANEAATISAVKSAPDTVRDFEDFLREAGKYSQQDAKLIASKGFNALLKHREGGDAALAQHALEGAMNQLRKLLPNAAGNGSR